MNPAPSTLMALLNNIERYILATADMPGRHFSDHPLNLNEAGVRDVLAYIEQLRAEIRRHQ